MSNPVIPLCRNIDDVIRGMNSLRSYYATLVSATSTQVSASKSTVTTNTVITLQDTFTDVGGTTKKGKIQIRFMGLNDDGSDQWQLEVVTVP